MYLPKRYIFTLVVAVLVAAIGLKLVWHFFMVRSYQPEWFILSLGLVFVAGGFLLSKEWFRLERKQSVVPGTERNIGEVAEAFGLSKAEREVLELLALGMSNSGIAEARHVSVNTVKTHISNIYQKMEVKNRLQVIAKLKDGA